MFISSINERFSGLVFSSFISSVDMAFTIFVTNASLWLLGITSRLYGVSVILFMIFPCFSVFNQRLGINSTASEALKCSVIRSHY